MSDYDPPLYLTREFNMDTRFSIECVKRIFFNALCILINVVGIYAAIDSGNAAFFVFVIFMFGDIIVSIGTSMLLAAAARRGGVARMATTLVAARKLPVLRQYALCSHRSELSLWYGYSLAHCTIDGAVWMLSTVIVLATVTDDYNISVALILFKLVEISLRFSILRNFYASAVMGSVISVLHSQKERNAYAESRSAAIRERLLRKNPENVAPTHRSRKHKVNGD